MAVAIPILIAATAAGATAAAAIGISATMLAIGTGLVLQVTGVNDKINKAASKVFGEKLVSVANIAGSIFLGATAAGLIGGAAEAAGGALAGAAGAAEGGAQAAANAAWSAGGVAEVAGGAGINGASSVLSGVDAAQSAANAAWSSGGAAEVAASRAAPTAFDGVLKTAQQGATKVGDGLKTAWNSLGDKGQSSLMQIGGQMVSGASAGKAAEEQEKARIANENRYKSGSGLSYWQRKPSYTPPAGA